MLDNLYQSGALPCALKTVCDDLPVPVSIADPDQPDAPLIYVNPAFEALTQYSAHEVIGQNCRFLQGHLTDKTVTFELGQACRNRTAESFCLINYRKDGSVFFNLVSVRPIPIGAGRTLIMGCQFAFQPTLSGDTVAQTCAMIDRAQHLMRQGTGAVRQAVGIHDTFRLDTLSMRFDTAFIRVRNMMISMNQQRLREVLIRRHDPGALLPMHRTAARQPHQNQSVVLIP